MSQLLAFAGNLAPGFKARQFIAEGGEARNLRLRAEYPIPGLSILPPDLEGQMGSSRSERPRDYPELSAP